MTRAESRCLNNCFHKTYRFLNYSNMLYSYLTADADTEKSIKESLHYAEDEDDEPNEEIA